VRFWCIPFTDAVTCTDNTAKMQLYYRLDGTGDKGLTKRQRADGPDDGSVRVVKYV